MTLFHINGKVALVTGGSSGIGLTYVQYLLENGAKGVCLADINDTVGEKVTKELEAKYGKNKVLFIKTDVTDYQQFEEAFKQTVAAFKNLDILINNAGTLQESEEMWRKTVEINVIGVLNGILLGLEHYLPKYKSGTEGLIVNTASTAGIQACPSYPIYGSTKFAVLGATLSFGNSAHYERQHVRVVAICPGFTRTSLFDNCSSYYQRYKETTNNVIEATVWQTLEEIAPKLLTVIQKAPNGTVWVLRGDEPPYQYVLPSREEVPKVYL